MFRAALGGENGGENRVCVILGLRGKRHIHPDPALAERVKDVVQHGLAVRVHNDALDRAKPVKLAGHFQVALQDRHLVVDDAGGRGELRGTELAHVLDVFRRQGVRLGKMGAGKQFDFTLLASPSQVLRFRAARLVGNERDAPFFQFQRNLRGAHAFFLEHPAKAHGGKRELVHRIGHFRRGEGGGGIKQRHRSPPKEFP